KAGSKPASNNVAIKDGNGELRTETDQIKKRWKEYIEELYSKISKPQEEDLALEKECQVDCDQMGPGLLDHKIEAAIKELKRGKAVGVDDIPAEFLKLLDESFERIT